MSQTEHTKNPNRPTQPHILFAMAHTLRSLSVYFQRISVYSDRAMTMMLMIMEVAWPSKISLIPFL